MSCSAALVPYTCGEGAIRCHMPKRTNVSTSMICNIYAIYIYIYTYIYIYIYIYTYIHIYIYIMPYLCIYICHIYAMIHGLLNHGNSSISLWIGGNQGPARWDPAFQAIDVGSSELPIDRTHGRSRPFRHQLFQFLG